MEAIPGGVREDGSLWIWDNMPENENRHNPLISRKLQRMGTETNWVTVAGDHWNGFTLVALKADGTLWRWEQKFSFYGQPVVLPVQAAGYPSEWESMTIGWRFVAIGVDSFHSRPMAALGTGRDRDMDAYERDGGQPLLAIFKKTSQTRRSFLDRNRRRGWEITNLTDTGGGFNHRRQDRGLRITGLVTCAF